MQRSFAQQLFLGLIFLCGCNSPEVPHYYSLTPFEIDLGGIDASQQPTYVRIEFENRGTAVLELIAASTSCSCTTTAWEEARLTAPGERNSFQVEIAPPQEPTFSRVVTLRTNDPAAPQVQYLLTGQIQKRTDWKPKKLSIRLSGYEERVARLMVLTTDPNLKILDHVVNLPNVSIEAKPPLNDGRHEIVVIVNGTGIEGKYRGELVLHTNSKHLPEITVPIDIVEAGSFEVRPNIVLLGTSDDISEIFIRRLDGGEPSITRIVTPSDQIVAEAVLDGDSIRLTVFVDGQVSDIQASSQSAIQVWFNDGKSVSVPLMLNSND